MFWFFINVCILIVCGSLLSIVVAGRTLHARDGGGVDVSKQHWCGHAGGYTYTWGTVSLFLGSFDFTDVPFHQCKLSVHYSPFIKNMILWYRYHTQ